VADQPQLPWTEAEGNGELVLSFDARVYSLEAIQRAAHWMTDRCYVVVEKDHPGEFVRVRLASKNGELPRTLAGELGNRVLDEELRRQILMETKTIREAIITQAFAEADLDDNRGASFADDPERIGPI
jgi:His-Xaa-Ser system protein HxsD